MKSKRGDSDKRTLAALDDLDLNRKRNTLKEEVRRTFKKSREAIKRYNETGDKAWERRDQSAEGSFSPALNMLDEEATVGRKLIDGGHKGSDRRWGTEATKAQRTKDYQQALDDCRRANPTWNKTRVREKVASRFSVSSRTIANHTTWVEIESGR
jgi:hypothetical protein